MSLDMSVAGLYLSNLRTLPTSISYLSEVFQPSSVYTSLCVYMPSFVQVYTSSFLFPFLFSSAGGFVCHVFLFVRVVVSVLNLFFVRARVMLMGGGKWAKAFRFALLWSWIDEMGLWGERRVVFVRNGSSI